MATSAESPRVLMVTGAYFPEMSGAGLQCRELVRQLVPTVPCTILTTVTDPALPAVDERDGVPVFRVRVDPTSLWSKLTAGLRMTRVFWRQRARFSILHLHGFSQKTMLLIALALLTGKRIVIKLTSVGHDDPMSMRARGRAAFWFFSRAHRFVAVSPRFETLYLTSGLPRDRFRLIPNGVNLERFRPASVDERRVLRQALGLPVDAYVTLFIGFFSQEKCPDVLFEAWARDAVHDGRRILLLVGATRSAYHEVDPQLADGIRARAAALGLIERVVFVESTQQIEHYHRAADVFALPSVREGQPNALLEAMACGTACVATRLDGVTDALLDDGVSGLLVPPRDVDALASALATLAASPELAQRMGAHVHARIAREFSAEAMGQQYVSTYRELLAS